MAAEEVAEVVAVVRAETRDFDRGMKSSDDTIDQSAERVVRAEKRKQRELDLTAAGLGRVKLGFLGAAGAAAAFAGIVSRSPSFGAHMQATNLGLGLVGEQLYRGTGLDDLHKGANDRIFDFARLLRDTRDADPTGQGNLALGTVATAQAKAEAAVTGGDYERGFDEGAAGGFWNRFGQFSLGAAGVPLSLAGAAVGDTEGAIEALERSRGRMAGSLTGGMPDINTMRDPVYNTPAAYGNVGLTPHIRAELPNLNDPLYAQHLPTQQNVNLTVDGAKDPDFQRNMGWLTLRSWRSFFSGGFD